MSTELTETRNRLRLALQYRGGCPWECTDAYQEGPGKPSARYQYVSDCEVLARADLAEHPEDQPQVDAAIKEWWLSKLRKHWVPDGVPGCGEPHLVNLISAARGWNPLEVNKRMTVTFGGSTYEIVRQS